MIYLIKWILIGTHHNQHSGCRELQRFLVHVNFVDFYETRL